MKLISINIEGDKHFDRIFSFIEKEKPDVLCIQELAEADIARLTQTGYSGTYLPMAREKASDTEASIGIALYTKEKPRNVRTFYYSKPHSEIPVFDHDDIPNSVLHGVIFADIEHNGKIFTIATTHFTWTPDGKNPCATQYSDTDTLLSHIEKEKAHVICGDFNIPRNINPLYPKFLEHYTDAIPMHYASSLDKNLHRHGINSEKAMLFDSFMVDYVFTQAPYIASEVRLEFGVSDHAAVVATITQ